MLNKKSTIQLAYLAGFLDGDGSIYVRAKQNSDYKYGFQIAPYVIFFQSKKEESNFRKIFSKIGFGYMRERKDGILEYTIARKDNIIFLLNILRPYLVLKRKQADLMIKILEKKEKVSNYEDFKRLMKLVERYRDLNYSKKRLKHKLTP